MKEMKGISIVVCTYNGLKTIGKTLEHISNQQIKDFPIELIVVDNNSNDGTYEHIVDKFKKINFSFPVKLLKEPISGKNNASIKGFSAAIFDYILICDDDNFLCDNYCQKAYEILNENKKVGLVGGKGIAVFENNKPEWFDKYEAVYACGQQYFKNGIIDDINVNLWGAGMVFRKEIWERIRELKYDIFMDAHRTKKHISGGEDTELSEIAKWMGYKLYYNENISFEHYIPTNRTNINYLKRRFRGLGKSRIYLRAYNYCLNNKELPGKNLKIPLWKDILIYRKRELIKFYPLIWFIKETPNNYDFILKHEALKSEIDEIKRLNYEYINIYKKLFTLKEALSKLII